MCIFGNPTPATPRLPAETAAMRSPDAGAVDASGRRVQDQVRAGTTTILTSGSGLTTSAPTEKKTLLGG